MDRKQIHEMLEMNGVMTIAELMTAFGVSGFEKAIELREVLEELRKDFYVSKHSHEGRKVYRVEYRTGGDVP